MASGMLGIFIVTGIIIIITLIMAAAAFCGCFKPGKKDNISNYDNLED